MAYSHKRIQAFIEKVDKEAAKAAQAIYDKRQSDLERLIKDQLKEGDEFLIGMGTAGVRNGKEYLDKAEEFSRLLSGTAYWDLAGFNLSDIKK